MEMFGLNENGIAYIMESLLYETPSKKDAVKLANKFLIDHRNWKRTQGVKPDLSYNVR